MNNKTMFLIRGLPGSGKSTLAATLTRNHFANDDFFTDEDGTYNFNPELHEQAREHCQERVRSGLQFFKESLDQRYQAVAVANTFCAVSEMEPYYQIALEYGYTVFVIECKNNFGSIHNVREHVILSMRLRWEHLDE